MLENNVLKYYTVWRFTKKNYSTRLRSKILNREKQTILITFNTKFYTK